MARITIEDCLEKINNRFRLIHTAANRVRQLRKGAEPLVVSRNRDIVVSLREIAAGYVVPREKTEGPELLESPLEDLLLDAPEPEAASTPPEEPLPEEEASEASEAKAPDEVGDEPEQGSESQE